MLAGTPLDFLICKLLLARRPRQESIGRVSQDMRPHLEPGSQLLQLREGA